MADNLWSLREQKRLSVATLASRAGLPIGLIMEYESGHRSIDPRHLTRIARALYVEESEIRLQSEPRPGAPPLERQQRGPEGRREEPRRDPVRAPAPAPGAAAPGSGAPPASAMPRGRDRQVRAPRTAFEPRPPAPARTSQIAHLQGLLQRSDLTQSKLEAELGKPISELTRSEITQVLQELQRKLREQTAQKHRPYLPEAVDRHELRYLTEARDSNAVLRFKLFDGAGVEGRVTGFGPYVITVTQADGTEVTLNKLAIVSYAREPLAAGEVGGGGQGI